MEKQKSLKCPFAFDCILWIFNPINLCNLTKCCTAQQHPILRCSYAIPELKLLCKANSKSSTLFDRMLYICNALCTLFRFTLLGNAFRRIACILHIFIALFVEINAADAWYVRQRIPALYLATSNILNFVQLFVDGILNKSINHRRWLESFPAGHLLSNNTAVRNLLYGNVNVNTKLSFDLIPGTFNGIRMLNFSFPCDCICCLHMTPATGKALHPWTIRTSIRKACS